MLPDTATCTFCRSSMLLKNKHPRLTSDEKRGMSVCVKCGDTFCEAIEALERGRTGELVTKSGSTIELLPSSEKQN
jgi:hypothetical protein